MQATLRRRPKVGPGAIAALERAAVLEACGAVGYRNEAERALGHLGRQFHHRQRATGAAGDRVAALTRRELEVATFVRARRTNREIAAEPFLSQKTVETN